MTVHFILASLAFSGDTLYYRFMSDMSNTEWGYKFTVTGGHRGRFQTGAVLLLFGFRFALQPFC